LEHELEALTQQIWKRLFGKFQHRLPNLTKVETKKPQQIWKRLFGKFQHRLPNLTKVETKKTQNLNKTNLQKTKKKKRFQVHKMDLQCSHKRLSIFELHNTILKQNKNLKRNQMNIKV